MVLREAGILNKFCYIYNKPDFDFLPEKFACVFFTGSTSVGRIVYQKAAQNFSRVVLELGGANPVLVCDDLSSMQLIQCCRQLVMAKYMNAGQTCISPNYVVVVGAREMYYKFIETLKRVLYEAYSKNENHICMIKTKQKYSQLAQIVNGAGSGDVITCLVDGSLTRDRQLIAEHITMGEHG